MGYPMSSKTLLLLVLLSAALSFGQAAKTPAIKVTLLGTAPGPPVRLNQYQTTTLVEANGERLLFDCGRGVLFRLVQAGVPVESVTKLFITHLHSDHVVDIPDLLLTPWANRSARKVPLQVWGPEGTVSMMDHLQKAFAADIHIRRDVDEKFLPEGIKVDAHDIEQGVIYKANGVTVTAFTVDHGPVKPSFGYRVDFDGHSVALSGDTRPSDNLVQFSKGVDVLIHETLDPDRFNSAAFQQTQEQRQAIINHHTKPEEAGAIFTRVKPKLAVFSHAETSPAILEKARKTYSGPLELGEDLMVIEIGDTVVVHRPTPSAMK
jgi:ribonuclease Z